MEIDGGLVWDAVYDKGPSTIYRPVIPVANIRYDSLHGLGQKVKLPEQFCEVPSYS